MIRYGIIDQINENTAFCRVRFEEDGIVSDWIPVMVQKSLKDKYYYCPDIGEHVVCMMDEHCERGVILGAIYSKDITPTKKGKDIAAVQFEDGSFVQFDRASGELKVDAKGKITILAATDVEIECVKATVTGSSEVKIDAPVAKFTGNIQASGTIVALFGTPAQVSLTTHMHPTAAVGSPSPPTPGT